jgi:hypothetical protein
MAEEAFRREELRELSQRASGLARRTDDPSVRTALQLLAEVAENLARKLPVEPAPDEGETVS